MLCSKKAKFTCFFCEKLLILSVKGVIININILYYASIRIYFI